MELTEQITVKMKENHPPINPDTLISCMFYTFI